MDYNAQHVGGLGSKVVAYLIRAATPVLSRIMENRGIPEGTVKLKLLVVGG